jgi:methylmalonyl-CoA decarboxylase
MAKEMFFTAGLVAAQRAERFGIINELVPAANLETLSTRLQRRSERGPPEAIRSSKETMRVLSEAVAISLTTYERLQGLQRGEV